MATATRSAIALYLREMDVWTLSRGYGNNFGSLSDAQSHLGLLDEFEDGFAQLQGTWHQDLIQSQPFALQQLPDLWVDGRRELLGNLAYAGLRPRCGQLLASDGALAAARVSMNPRLRCRGDSEIMSMASLLAGLWGNMYEAFGHELNVIPVGQRAPVGPNGTVQNLIYNNFLESGSARQSGLQHAMDSVCQDRHLHRAGAGL